MLPSQPWLIKCPHCTALVWMDEQEQVAEIKPLGATWELAERFTDARSAPEPTLAEYTAFLSAGIGEKEKERYVRLRVWWAGNDARRDGGQDTPLTDMEAANLRAFVSLLDETNDNDRVMKAEALRELGMFADAEALLESRFEEGLMQAVGFIRSLNQERSTAVVEMRFE